ncbi:MAG: helix-turn-helix domain-containing protein [Patescibacteria group bacterium]
MHTQPLKLQAITLRKQGKSLLQISKELHIAKSTASLWLSTEKNRGLYSKMTQTEWMRYILDLAHKAITKRIRNKDKERQESATLLTKQLPTTKEVMKVIIAMLYWAEGSKGYEVVKFANTDPRLCLLFITTLRSCFDLDEAKFRIGIHLQQHHQEEDEKTFWSNLLRIPLSQFNKTVWKKTPNTGKRYRKNYHGICFVKYNSVNLQKEIMVYAYALGAKFIDHALIAQLD